MSDNQQESNATDIAVLNTKVDNIQQSLNQLNDNLTKNYVTIDRYSPIERITYLLVGLILTTVVGAMLALIILK